MKMELFLHNGHTFPVPVPVADHFLGLASHDQLKVLLYVLCHAGEPLTEEQIAKGCKVLPSAVEEAIVFWQNANVLQNSEPAVSVRIADAQSASAVPPAPEPEPQTQPEPPQSVTVPRVQISSSNFALMPSEIAARIQNNMPLAELFRAAEQLLGRPLNHTEQKSMIWMHEYLGLAPDVLLMLAAFCIRSDTFHVRYVEQVAVEWQERGVTSHAEAEADIRRRTEARSYTGKVMKLFEMRRRPTALQQSYIDQWQAAQMPVELVQLAYEKTRNQKDDKLSWSYLNGILKRWAEKGVRTVADAEQEDADFYAAKDPKRRGKGKAASADSNAQQTHSSIDLDDVAKLINRFG